MLKGGYISKHSNEPHTRPTKHAQPSTQIFTERHLVGQMCELCEPQLSDVTKKVFEPSCGNGNFLVEVLHRRLVAVSPTPRNVLLILSNLYGLDIDTKLVVETRHRLRAIVSDFVGKDPIFDDHFFALVDQILVSNVIVGDLLESPTKIFFSDWTILDTPNLTNRSSDTSGLVTLTAQRYSLADILQSSQLTEISPRPEQQNAIDKTFSYWQKHHTGGTAARFLWNAKPRFGKTFTAYQFAGRISAQRVLIVSNRPAISDSWARDFYQFVAPSSDAIFASAKGGEVLIDGKKHHIYSRAELLRNHELLNRPLFFFISLQDLKGKDNSGNFKTKNRWLFQVQKPWDLLVIDESHDGVSTIKTRQTLAQIKANFALFLSGTPFRAIANQEFSDAQIFNWTYLDEQTTKFQSTDDPSNPYADLPSLKMFIYNTTSELFRTKNGHFLHEDAVCQWLDTISATGTKTPFDSNLPFATDANRRYFRHTFWLLSHIDECHALAKLLCSHPFFRDYEVVIVAGKDEAGTHNPERALSRVRRAIGEDPTETRTITLSCGRLTTGVTIPAWTAVLMLGTTSDLTRASSAQYLQAAFRAQNPWRTKDFVKTAAYIYDWSPDRALLAIRDYALRLCAKPKVNDTTAVSELLKYLPISLVGSDGKISALSPSEIVALPAKFAAQEIVEGNFVASDKLFRLEKLSQLSPAAHRVINRLYALKKHGFETTPEPIIDTLPPTAETNTIYSDPRRSHKKKTEDDYRAKLHGFTSVIPLLLHLYGEPGQTLAKLVAVTPDDVFLQLVGLPKSDFQVLFQEDFFDETNCMAAISEFMFRAQRLAPYYQLTHPQTIFSHIPLQRQYVFTPLHVVERMLDYLESQRPALFRSSHSIILDPCAKSGLFLAMATRRLFKNLRPTFPSDRACLQHILSQQIYAWSPDSLAREITLCTLLNFTRYAKNPFSNTTLASLAKHLAVYNPSDGKSVINYVKVLRECAEFWEDDVKFDIILGNPPYQAGRRQVYADFYRLAVDLNPELLCLIFPLGWQKVTNTNGLKQLNNFEYKRDPHLVLIDNYYESDDRRIFPEIGTGGVNIVLRDRNYDNHGKIRKLEYGTETNLTVLPVETHEIEKPTELECLRELAGEHNLATLGSARRPYGFCAEPLRRPWKYQLTLRDTAERPDDLRLFGLFPNGKRGYKYISAASLPKASPSLSHYKLFVPKAWGNMSQSIGLGGSYSDICLARPGDVCAETFIEFGPFATRDEAYMMAKYFMTKFFRACLFLAKTSQNTARDKYRYVPLPDFSLDFWQGSIDQIDDALFRHFQIPSVSCDFIRQNFQTRTVANIKIL